MRNASHNAGTPNSSNQAKPRASAARFEQQEKESAKAYQAFSLYRDLPLGERSLTTVSQQLGKTRSLCARWSVTFRWVERASAWDSHQDQKRRNRLAAERDKIQERQLQHAQIAAQALMAPMVALAKRAKTQADAFANVPTAELTKLAAWSARALPAIHEDERRLAAPTPEDADKQLPVTISGADFTWVQGRCRCGHPWEQHDQSAPAEHAAMQHATGEQSIVVGMACTAQGCKCTGYLDE